MRCRGGPIELFVLSTTQAACRNCLFAVFTAMLGLISKSCDAFHEQWSTQIEEIACNVKGQCSTLALQRGTLLHLHSGRGSVRREDDPSRQQLQMRSYDGEMGSKGDNRARGAQLSLVIAIVQG